uniref:Mannose receptor, C type 1b n=1 Tax=Esox lucius TaxID=8010 RepID=A0A6Q2YAE0_ESOLU
MKINIPDKVIFLTFNGPFVLYNTGSKTCLGPCNSDTLRWLSEGRLYYTKEGKCLGVSGKTEGSSVVYLDCDGKSDLQQWECHNNTLLTLKGHSLYLNNNNNNKLVLSKDTGSRSLWVIFGTTEGPCTRTHRELYTIDGNAFGRPCQFPFRYKDKWYVDCTTIDSSVKRLWCAIETNYQDNELWGYCPTTTTEHWHKNPVTGSFYQLNLHSALTWHQARTSCQQQGADLASITEPHQQTYISAHVSVWTGLNALEEDGLWQWISGKPFPYFRWDSGHPLRDPGQVCGMVDSSQQSFWQSSLCSKTRGYICQKDPPATHTVHPESGFCSHPWIHYAGRCYRIEHTKKTWTEGQTECRKDGGDLASIHNIEQQSFVMSQLGYVATEELWIGLNDVKTPLLFEWSDQSAVTFTSWDSTMPAGGNCVLVRGEKVRWSTQECEKQYGFICMKRSSSQPSGPQVDTNPGCKPHWIRYGSYCYFVGQETKTFDEANENCRSLQSNLVDVSSGVDNAFLISLVGYRPEKHFWIGLSNQKHIDIFTWTNGNRVKYTHWNAQMPGISQGCVAMTTGILAGLWDVLSCTNQEKYICKHQAEGVVPTQEPVTPVLPSCPEDWDPVGSRNYCFKFFTGPRKDEKTWFEAREFCKAIGGDLLSIHSATDLHRRGKAWIGLSAQDPNAGYVWTDGSPLYFQNWKNGEPNNYNGVESCAEMYFSYSHYRQPGGSWNDAHCESYNDWMCEIRKVLSPSCLEYNVTEDGWLEYGGSQYYFNSHVMAMEDARDFCRQRHADLAVINTLTENTFLWKKVRGFGSHYIGLTVDLDKSFGWMDGSPVVFQRWDENQPDFKNNDENCVVMTSYLGELKTRSDPSLLPSLSKMEVIWASSACSYIHCILMCPQCYKLIGYRSPSTWLEARKQCQSVGANLASIANRGEQVFLTTQMGPGATDLWIGLNSLERSSLVWTDGRARKYFNWVPNWVCITHSILGKWKLISCNDTHGFICQRKVGEKIIILHILIVIHVLLQNMTWSEARVQCETEQGQLASTLDELSAAYLELQALKLETPVWIGLNKDETQGYFRWIDGWHLNMVQWAKNEPSRDRPCVYLDVDGTWKTSLCNHTYPSVCKQSTGETVSYPSVCKQSTGETRSSYWLITTGWLPFRGHCYSFFTDDMVWTDASTSCLRKGATLVSIEDPVELNFIMKNLEFLKDSHPSFWIGLYKTHLGQWKWLDESVLDYTNWAEGEPRNSSRNIYGYGRILSSDGTWSTGTSWSDKPYICKRPKSKSSNMIELSSDLCLSARNHICLNNV